MSRRWSIVALAAVATAAGCGGSGNGGHAAVRAPNYGAWASPSELRWLRSVGAWQDQLSQTARQVAATTATNNLATALSPLAHCGDLLQNDVGRPPTRRLARPYSLLRRACTSWSRATAILAGSGGVPAAHASVRRALSLLQQADTLLPPAELRPLPAGAPSARQSRIVPRLSQVASQLARRHATVRCWSGSDWPRLVHEERELSVSRIDDRDVGLTSLSAHRINLDPAICAALGRLLDGRPVALARATSAVEVLAHESQHASGIADEAVADCFGMQSIRRTAQLLRLPAAYGGRLASEYWRHWNRLPAIYRSPDCRDGGLLDLHPHSSRWP